MSISRPLPWWSLLSEHRHRAQPTALRYEATPLRGHDTRYTSERYAWTYKNLPSGHLQLDVYPTRSTSNNSRSFSSLILQPFLLSAALLAKRIPHPALHTYSLLSARNHACCSRRGCCHGGQVPMSMARMPKQLQEEVRRQKTCRGTQEERRRAVKVSVLLRPRCVPQCSGRLQLLGNPEDPFENAHPYSSSGRGGPNLPMLEGMRSLVWGYEPS